MFLKPLLARMSVRVHNTVHKGHDLMHCVYLSAVSIEAHGWYGKAALGLLAFTIIAALLGEPVE